MSKISKSVNIPGPIAPYDSNDTYATHSAIYGKGGWKSVTDLDALKLIPSDRLENGCIVRIVNPDGYNNAVEFYYDDSVVGSEAPSTVTDEIEREVYSLGFRKWTPGYLPTQVSELENDVHYIEEVIGDDGYPIDPTDSTNITQMDQILDDRDMQDDGQDHLGLYNELGKAYLHKNEYTTSNGKSIYGLVTVQENGKINPDILENSVIYVVMLEGFFPDDFGTLLTNEIVNDNSNPTGMNEGAKYFVTSNYQGLLSDDMYKIATATDTDNWTTTNPSQECIYINKARNEAYICENLNTDLVCIGRGNIINDLGEFGEDDFPDEVRDAGRWDETPLSAEMGYWLKQHIEMVYECVIDGLTSRIDQEIEDRRNADDVIRNYTVNSIPISQNPVITGANAYLTGYDNSTTGTVSSGDSINTAISKLENSISELSSTGGAASDLINDHANRRDNPHEVTKDQVGLGESDEVTFAKVTAANGFFQSSDSRLKEEIRKISNGTGKIRLVQFRWKDTGEIGFGIIADELEKSYPSLVKTGKNGYKTVNYTEALIIKISQLEDEIELLKKELQELKNNK